MSSEDIIKLVFEDRKDVRTILGHSEVGNLHEAILKHGISMKRFLCLDYKGENDQEIVNYILDYEFNHNIELASQEELEELGEFEYEFLPEKIREVNKVISKMGYGLFSYPTFSDFYALFIDKLENKTKLLQIEFPIDEGIPSKEKFIQYYS
ncbi:DUF6630 family protein [Clostridium estertheticum]|uniref:DUF6630 family protein n=1 Tax=Clostridium estertheticum TaxID=238834 RepID=UPI001C0B5D12|nr:hypothetical protein [Clostridium estertheticum]MBU3075533.1 hypothetical protein [Clostridium estertheticum]MBU3165637.1 hypothetical protein [Clostridium estertheticum]